MNTGASSIGLQNTAELWGNRMTTPEMVEKCARAIAAARGFEPDRVYADNRFADLRDAEPGVAVPLVREIGPRLHGCAAGANHRDAERGARGRG